MTTTTQRQALRSSLPWMGGKYHSAPRIVKAFPPLRNYDVYVDLFGGAAHVLLQRSQYKHHVEVYNDINSDLVNFWMQCRDHAEALEARCRSLPYSRELYYQYHASLYDGHEDLKPLERAVRWFYVLRSSFTSREGPSPNGWDNGIPDSGFSAAHSYHSALNLFAALQARFQDTLIDHRDFEPVFHSYDQSRTLFYVDPPYIDAEGYYQHPFTLEDHQRLAALLNSSLALIAVSYYPHTLLETLYPPSRWRRITWMVTKHSQRTEEQREKATEMLLCNYPEPVTAYSLWNEEVI